jgi:hypothetical protein
VKLFQPNNLSRGRPEFAPVTDSSIGGEIISLLTQHYHFPEFSELRISAFVGANISSHNFKLETTAAKTFLKSREEHHLAQTRREAELTFALSELGQPVPRIIRAHNNELVTLHEGKCWVLYEFQEGDYFSGEDNELQAAAEAFGSLSLAAQQLFSDAVVTPEALPPGLAELLNRSKATELTALCSPHEQFILQNVELIERQMELFDRSVPVHLDYHPLNLLLHENRVACIVDLEHLKPYPVVAGLGFAGYKLIRQAMVDDTFRTRELNERAAVSTWLHGWQKSFPADQFTAGELGIGARFRILKLIHLILDAFINQHDARYVYDLEKQILSLYEADMIFGRD